MKIIHKLFISFAVIVTPITFFGILTTTSLKNELQIVGDFNSSNLYLIQNNETKMIEAVEENFVYVASDEESEKKAFLAWAEKVNLATKELRKLEKEDIQNDQEEKVLFEKVVFDKKL